MNEQSAGGIIRTGMVAVAKNFSGHYSFPKGHLKKGKLCLRQHTVK